MIENLRLIWLGGAIYQIPRLATSTVLAAGDRRPWIGPLRALIDIIFWPLVFVGDEARAYARYIREKL